jgi:hypothetical protein
MILNRTFSTTQSHVDRCLRAFIFQVISLQFFAVFMTATLFTGFGFGRILACILLTSCFLYAARAAVLLFRHRLEPHDKTNVVLAWTIQFFTFSIFLFEGYLGIQYILR